MASSASQAICSESRREQATDMNHPDVNHFMDNATTFPGLIDATHADLMKGLDIGLFTSVDLVKAYLARIEQVNGKTHAVTEVNPDALDIAQNLDEERSRGNIRGKLHGLPVLVKNNIGTLDKMNNTAGSWLLVGAKVPRDAGVVKKLREAGAVILGKTNLCQWAGMRCHKPSTGWSAHGGQMFAAYHEDQEPHGSSGGSAISVDLGLAFAALGTETDGSVTWPAQRSNCVGVKPTAGLTSRDMVIPISERMDSVGTLARTVRDSAILLQAIVGEDPNDRYTTAIPGIPDFEAACKADALRGTRIGVPWEAIRQHPQSGDFVEEIRIFESALEILKLAGATIVDVQFECTVDDIRKVQDPVTAADMVANMAEYLGQLTSNPSGVRSLADIRDQSQSCGKEGYPEKNTFYFDKVLKHGWDNKCPEFQSALDTLREIGGPRGLIGALDSQDLVAAVMPTSFAPEWTALLGAPMISVPMGYYPETAKPLRLADGIIQVGPGVPVGLSFMGRLWSDAELIGLGYAYEQRTKYRDQVVSRVIQPSAELQIGSQHN